jgi:hypothetical protein
MRARANASSGPFRIVGTPGQQLRRHRARNLALAGSTGAVEQVRVRRAAIVLERGAEYRACVRMPVELREHPSMVGGS